MPLLVFDTKGIPATRRERIEAAVEAGGKHASGRYQAWISADPFQGGVRVLRGPYPNQSEVGAIRFESRQLLDDLLLIGIRNQCTPSQSNP